MCLHICAVDPLGETEADLIIIRLLLLQTRSLRDSQPNHSLLTACDRIIRRIEEEIQRLSQSAGLMLLN
jgi:hypothetical protein